MKKHALGALMVAAMMAAPEAMHPNYERHGPPKARGHGITRTGAREKARRARQIKRRKLLVTPEEHDHE